MPREDAPGPGVHRVEVTDERPALLFVPRDISPDARAGLVLMLHGAGGDSRQALERLREHADAERLILLAPKSLGSTWDVLLGAYGPDVDLIDRLLRWAFDRFPVDPAAVVIDGFSDGASYALSLGLANGDLFTHVMAFSPGFMAPPELVGRPRIFISHGTRDRVLPIGVTSRRLVPRLQRGGYDVRYHGFSGGHEVPDEVLRDALVWLRERPA